MNNRIARIQRQLKAKRLDGILVSSSSHIAYLTGYGGFSDCEREAFLLIGKDKSYLFTDRRYREAVKKLLPEFEHVEVTATISFSQAIQTIIQEETIKRLGFDAKSLSVYEYHQLQKYLNDIYHLSVLRPASSIAEVLKVIKDQEEIALIQKACELTDKAYEYVLNDIKPGVTERELATELEYWIKKQGADVAFSPIIAFGKNSAIPHHKTSNQRLKTKDQVLIDFGVRYELYCSDMTRVVFVGRVSNEQKRMYQTVLEAQQKALDFLSSTFHRLPSGDRSVEASRVDAAARSHILSKGYPSIPHSLGHGVGIEVHEAPKISPVSKDVLKPGMVFTLEPGIYNARIGGVRIEDVVVLEKTGLPRRKAGPRLLTHSSRTLVEL